MAPGLSCMASSSAVVGTQLQRTPRCLPRPPLLRWRRPGGSGGGNDRRAVWRAENAAGCMPLRFRLHRWPSTAARLPCPRPQLAWGDGGPLAAQTADPHCKISNHAADGQECSGELQGRQDLIRAPTHLFRRARQLAARCRQRPTSCHRRSHRRPLTKLPPI